MKTNNRLTWGLYGAIASLTMSLSMAIATLELSLGLQPVLASPVLTSPEYATKQKQDKPKVVRIAGNYKTIFTPEFWRQQRNKVYNLSQDNGLFNRMERLRLF